MRVRCSECEHETYVPDDELASASLGDMRCANCGTVGLLVCAHNSCHNDACDDCGKDFS